MVFVCGGVGGVVGCADCGWILQAVLIGCGRAARRFAVALVVERNDEFFNFLLAIAGKLHV